MEDGARFKGRIDMGERREVEAPPEPVRIEAVAADKLSA